VKWSMARWCLVLQGKVLLRFCADGWGTVEWGSLRHCIIGVLFCKLLCSRVGHGSVLFGKVLFGTAKCCRAWSCSVLCCRLRYHFGEAKFGTLLRSVAK
jgi:hypothetical protein